MITRNLTHIVTALLISQGGLGLGITNAMLPLRKVSKKEKLILKQESSNND